MNHRPAPLEMMLEQAHHLIQNDGQLLHDQQYQTWDLDDQAKAQVIELQKVWIEDFKKNREKNLVDMVEKLHQEFLSDQQKIRTELLTQFKDELDMTKLELEAQYRESLQSEVAKAVERHKKEISMAKRKTWCHQCDKEAMYDCCRGIAYCSPECQRGHWAIHRKTCKRKPQNNGTANGY